MNDLFSVWLKTLILIQALKLGIFLPAWNLIKFNLIPETLYLFIISTFIESELL